MHKNTAIFIALLAVIAALLLGINIGKRLNIGQSVGPTPIPVIENSTPSPFLIPTPEPSIQTLQSYNLRDCGISFMYEPTFSLREASSAAILTNMTTQEQINVVCVDEIPRPPLPPDKIENTVVAGIKTKLYHDGSAKDGSPVDAVIFTHPQNKLDIGIFGFGESFEKLVKTIQLINSTTLQN